MKTVHRTIIGDSRKMLELPGESVHLVVTSPPYWQLKDYGSKNQLGFHDHYEDYINNLNLVWLECYRVLHPGCRLCVNIGDQFARSVYYGRYKVIPIRTEIIKFCETIGFDYMGAIIWQKVTTTNTTGGASIMGSFPYPRNGIVKIDYEFILLFKKIGISPKVDQNVKAESRLTTEEWNEYFSGHWNFPGERQDKHLAMFPIELPKRLIRMFSFVGETVLDPFLGSGTTSLAAIQTNRNSIGFEINPEFTPVIRDKLGIGKSSLFADNLDWQLDQRESNNVEEAVDFSTLPYKFVDPLKLNAQIDPRKLKFGSKIEGKDSNEKVDRYYRVRKVISPDQLILDTGVTIKLLGIVPRSGYEEASIEYLQTVTKSTQVSLGFDENGVRSNDLIEAYLYLKNRTFVNAHLIKQGFAYPDHTRSFRYRERFLKYYSEFIN